MDIQTIAWSQGKIRIIDQTKLPLRFEYMYISDIKVLWKAIKELKVRGAPALGACAALGVYLGVKDSKAKTGASFRKEFNRAACYLASSRPTARNLFWGIERMEVVFSKNPGVSVETFKKLLFKEAREIIESDRATCRLIGLHGARQINGGDRVLTICNAGILATIDYGTALGVIYRAQEEGKDVMVYACETRPLLQGARLTTWELARRKVKVTLICDSMAATLMRQGKIDKVVTGADRIAANGDSANKIGTYNLAVLCRYHHIPFYIAAPVSTFDMTIASGREIIIEERPASEVTELMFKKNLAVRGVKVYNPAFDVTPYSLITGIITEKGIIFNPNTVRVKKHIGK